MDWQIGCFSLPWSEFSFDRALEGIKAAGYAYLGLGSTHQGEQALENGCAGAREIGIKLEALGLTPVMMFASWEGDTGVEDFKTRIDQAKLLGIRFMLTSGTSTGTEGEVSEEEAASAEAQFLARMSQIVPYSGENGITILLKPHLGNTAYGPVLRSTLNKVGSRWVRACYDPGNVRFYAGLSPEVDLLHVLPYLSGLCIKDHKGQKGERNFSVPGAGDIDFRRIFRILKKHRFSGPMLVEQVGETNATLSAEDIDERVQQANEFLQRAIQQVEEET